MRRGGRKEKERWLVGWLAGWNSECELGEGREALGTWGSAGVVWCRALSSLALAPRRVRDLVAFTEVRSVSDT